MVRKWLSAGEQWREHCKEEHPRKRVKSCVRNLTGTAAMCCIGDCEWSVGCG
jgi:hypothetical protein